MGEIKKGRCKLPLKIVLETLTNVETNIREFQNSHQEGVKKLQKRAKTKYKSSARDAMLIDIANKTNSTRLNEAVSMWNCGRIATVENGKATGRYCHSKYCPLCSKMKAMNRVEKYSPELQEMNNPVFITLTLPNVEAGLIAGAQKYMVNTWRKIYKNLHQKGVRVKGMWSMETTINVETKTVHPHIHMIVEGDINTMMIRPDELTEEDSRNKYFRVSNTVSGDRRKSLQYVSNENTKYREGDHTKVRWTNDIIELWLQFVEDADERAQHAKPLIADRLINCEVWTEGKYNALEMFKYSVKGYECNIKKLAGMDKANADKTVYETFREIYIPMLLEVMEKTTRLRNFQTFGGFGKSDEGKAVEQVEQEEAEEIELKATIRGIEIDNTTLTLVKAAYIDTATGEIIAEHKATWSETQKIEVLTDRRSEGELQQIVERGEKKLMEIKKGYKVTGTGNRRLLTEKGKRSLLT